MCGRYALGIRAAFVRRHLQDHGMPVDEAPEDDETRESYNFAPGYNGLVYRADVPDYGAGPRRNHNGEEGGDADAADDTAMSGKEVKYKLQAMKWGLVPFWTKRNPDYGTVLKTINARDDSLMENRGMWNTMKQRKRCIIVAQGFYEWLKKNGGKEKIPHFVSRKDGQLMCFAGLWDVVQYEGSEEKIYTYTIITTDSNKQLKFLHDRMPVILENSSNQVRVWLDPNRYEWSKELQSLLKPFSGELECYAVSKDVGKVGNNSPDFMVPVASSANKNNIANFFSSSKTPAKTKVKQEEKQERFSMQAENSDRKIAFTKTKAITDEQDDRNTVEIPRTEDNAPVPVPNPETPAKSLKREREVNVPESSDVSESPAKKLSKEKSGSPIKLGSPSKATNRKTRSATSNQTPLKGSPAKAADGSQRITNFFKK